MVSFQELIKEVIGLFKEKKQFLQPDSFIKSVDESSFNLKYNNFQPPIKGNYYSSGAYSPNTPTNERHPKGHKGVDIRAAGGTSVFPITDGIVINTSFSLQSGNAVMIQHPNNIKTLSAHLGTVTVHKGDSVSKETPIGTVGNTGNAKDTAPHIHFQLWENEQLQDPSKYFNVPKYTDMNKDEKMWLSENDKLRQQNFRMSEHVAKNKKAFSINVDKLYKIAVLYSKYTNTNINY